MRLMRLMGLMGLIGLSLISLMGLVGRLVVFMGLTFKVVFQFLCCGTLGIVDVAHDDAVLQERDAC